MKRSFVISVLLAVSLMCGAQEISCHKSAVGLDIGSLAGTTALKIYVSRSLARHWTVEAGMGAGLSHLRHRPDEDEAVHYGEIGDIDKTRTHSGQYGYMRVAYWPQSIYDGAFICSGCVFGSRTTPDIVIGAGYNIRIWEGLSSRISFLANMMETFSSRHIAGELLAVGINYIF